MRRRDALLAIGAAATAWPSLTFGQRRAPAQRIGYLSQQPELQANPFAVAFLEGLSEAGYEDGKNLAIEWRFTPDRDQLPAFARELVQLNPAVIVATGGAAVRAAKAATNSIPIVMSYSGDPVGTGLVPSLSRPGGNLTGLSFMSPDLSAKRVELLVEAFPTARRVSTLWNPEDPVYALELERTERAARSFGLTLVPISVRSVSDFEGAFSDMVRSRVDALIVFAHALTISPRRAIIALAARHRIPTVYGLREYVVDRGLMAYGPSLTDLFRRAAFYVDRLLKGSRPADLPIEQPTKFELTINAATARVLGLSIPPTLLARADEVIE